MKQTSVKKILAAILATTVFVALFAVFSPKGVYASDKKYQTAVNKLENAGIESMVRRAFKKEMFLEKAENDGWLLYTQTTTSEYKITSGSIEYLTKHVANNGDFGVYATYIPNADLGKRFTATMFVREMNATKNFNFKIADRKDETEPTTEFKKAVESKARPIDGRKYEFKQKSGEDATNGEVEVNDYSKINFDKIATEVKVYNYKNDQIEDTEIKVKYILAYGENEKKYSNIEDLRGAVAKINAQEVAQIKITTVAVGSDGKEKHQNIVRTYKYNKFATTERSLNEVQGIGKEKLTKMQKGIIAMATILSIAAIAGTTVGIVFGIKKKKAKETKESQENV